MAKCFINDTTLTNIGNAIRGVNGSSDLMLPSAMPDAISSLNNGLYVWKKLTADGGDFIDFVVSDSETAYPDRAVHTDGYWYKKFDNSTLIPENIREGIDIWGVVGTLVEGVAGIDFGEVTLTSTSSSVTFNHNLGVVPSFAAFIPKDNPTMGSSEETTLMNINGLIIYRKGFRNDKTGAYSYSYLRGTADVTLTETTVSFNSASSYKFKKTTYYWIAIA